MTNTRPQRYCKPCDSKTHDESQCWGECPYCGQGGHQSNFCRFKKNKEQSKTVPQTGRADKAAPKGKKKKRRAGKRVAVNDNGSRRESEEEEDISEEESPRKPDNRTETARSARLNFVQPSYRNLNDQLSNLNEEERKNLTIKGNIRRVNIARQDDDAVISSTAYSKMVGGKCTHTDCVMDSRCNFPLTSTAVVEAIGAEVMPLKQKI